VHAIVKTKYIHLSPVVIYVKCNMASCLTMVYAKCDHISTALEVKYKS